MDGHHEGCLHGAFHVVDRLEAMIKYEGYQVAPAELEAVLLTHDGVADAAVVGVRDGRGEEVPKAFVVSSGTAPEIDAEEVWRSTPWRRGGRGEQADGLVQGLTGNGGRYGRAISR